MPPTDLPPSDRALKALRNRFAFAAAGLLAGIILNVLGETGLGPWVFLGSALFALFTTHKIGRLGVEHVNSAPARHKNLGRAAQTHPPMPPRAAPASKPGNRVTTDPPPRLRSRRARPGAAFDADENRPLGGRRRASNFLPFGAGAAAAPFAAGNGWGLMPFASAFAQPPHLMPVSLPSRIKMWKPTRRFLSSASSVSALSRGQYEP